MVVIHNYTLAVILCFVVMLCWGSWGNTQKAAAKNWRYELFYWDYVIGMVIFSLILAFSLGSFGSEGRCFCQDLAQASWSSVLWVALGGVIFNAANILLSASTSIAGMSVAFPLGCGIALVLGVINNLIVEVSQGALKSNVVLLAVGVVLVVAAVVLNGIASAKKAGSAQVSKDAQKKGIILAVVAGVIMSFFSSFVLRAMDLTDFSNMQAGKIGPFTAMVLFSVAVLVSHFAFGPVIMKKPFVGEPVPMSAYFKGDAKTHVVGMCGGAIWCLGTSLTYITASAAGASVSYALGQGGPMVAAIWGIFVWKEFKGSGKNVYSLLALMFLLFIAGLSVIVASGN